MGQGDKCIQIYNLRTTTCVRITYNEDSNVIMMVTGGASQLRGSEPF